jgi:hypothetical protein
MVATSQIKQKQIQGQINMVQYPDFLHIIGSFWWETYKELPVSYH